jgi:VCBS repeat-containing protein
VRLSLDNGQVWTFNASDALIYVGDAVTIKRGALGSFLLTTQGHRTYKAERSQ